MHTISVIVPVYKVENYIHRCVDSILGQTYTDFELILVDDGSPDNCGAICDEYAAKDSRVVVIHQENGGLSAARNAGIDWAFANSNSEWLTFIDSDDWVHHQYLELLLLGVEKYGADMSIGNYQTVDEINAMCSIDSPRMSLFRPAEFYSERIFLSVAAWNKIYKKELFHNVRYPIGKLCEDAFTTYKLLFSSRNIALIDECLYFYYRNDAGIMRSNWKPAKMDEIIAWEEQIVFLEEKGISECLVRAVRRYIAVLYEQKRAIEKTKWRKSKYYWIVWMKLRHQLVRHYRIFPFKENAVVYEHGFPVVMWCYWTCKGIVKKIRRGI